jgi:tetratricopeptide (TPR) repeat protein
MDKPTLFNEALLVADKLMRQGASEDALVVLELVADNEAFGSIRVIACVNCAQVHVQRNEIEHALVWYDRGIVLEEHLHTCLAARYKATLLAEHGRAQEARELYLELLDGPLQPEDAQSIRQALAALAPRP